MKLQKKAKRLLAKFDRVLAKLKSLSHLPEEEKKSYLLSALDIIQKLEEADCDYLYLETNIVILLQEVSDQRIKCASTLTALLDVAFRLLEHPQVEDLSYILCYDTFFLECSNAIRYDVSSNYRLVDYILSELLDEWEVHDCEVNRHMFDNFQALLRYGITTAAATKCKVGETELTPYLLVDLLILSLDMYHNHVYDFGMDEFYELDNLDRRAKVTDTYYAFILLSLRALPPISDSLLLDRCQECGVDPEEILTAISMLTPSVPQLEERIGSLHVSSLKHLSRCAVRKRLYENWALPDGMKVLELPDTLKAYLDLKSD